MTLDLHHPVVRAMADRLLEKQGRKPFGYYSAAHAVFDMLDEAEKRGWAMTKTEEPK